MSSEIVMPKLSDTMTEGALSAWRKSVGERIERGDIIAEVETDKAIMDLEAFASGILLEQRVGAGELVQVGTVIGLIGEAGEAPAPRPAVVSPAPAVDTSLPPPAAVAEAAPVIPGPKAAIAAPPFERSSSSRAQAAPIVRRRAAELGIDLDQVPGSGPGGRIMLEDLERLVPPSAGLSAGPEAPQPEDAPESRPLSRMRSAIARTTTSSWQNIPHFYLSRDFDMGPAEQLAAGLKTTGRGVSLNTMVMAAVAAALTRFPALNAGYVGNGVVQYRHVNLAFAVALDDGLQAPVIREAETKTLQELASEAAALAGKARQGTLTPADISGGSFTVSNLGMYGVDAMVSIIMPGQAGILALGTVTDRPVVREGRIEPARIMTATLSCDHRIVDGVAAVQFLNEIKRLLEHPDELPV